MRFSSSALRPVNWQLFFERAIWLSTALLILELRCSRFERRGTKKSKKVISVDPKKKQKHGKTKISSHEQKYKGGKNNKKMDKWRGGEGRGWETYNPKRFRASSASIVFPVNNISDAN